MKMRDTRMKDKQRLNSIFLEMGMDKDVASIISGINKKNNDIIITICRPSGRLLEYFIIFQ